jgi:hypothetical protein
MLRRIPKQAFIPSKTCIVALFILFAATGSLGIDILSASRLKVRGIFGIERFPSSVPGLQTYFVMTFYLSSSPKDRRSISVVDPNCLKPEYYLLDFPLGGGI